MNKKIISTDFAPKAIGPYSQAVVANGFLFISGQPDTLILTEGVFDAPAAHGYDRRE